MKITLKMTEEDGLKFLGLCRHRDELIERYLLTYPEMRRTIGLYLMSGSSEDEIPMAIRTHQEMILELNRKES